jgi:hypothetical protein
MSKIAFLAFGLAAATSTVAAVYYVSPAVLDRQQGTPPILVDATPAQIMPKLRAIRLESYFAHVSENREPFPNFISMRQTAASALSIQQDIFVGGDNPLRFIVTVRPVGATQSEVDVAVLLPASRFRANAALHPYEADTIAAMIDLAATDYVSSIVKSHRPMTGREVETELKKRFDYRSDQADSMGDRVGKALETTYRDYLDAWNLRAEAQYGAQSDATRALEEAAESAAAQAAADAARAANAAQSETVQAAFDALPSAPNIEDANANAAAASAAQPTPGWGVPTVNMEAN